MTFREKLADIISGGAITRAKKNLDIQDARFREARFELCRTRVMVVEPLRRDIRHILASTETTTNGTGKMVARLCREALELSE